MLCMNDSPKEQEKKITSSKMDRNGVPLPESKSIRSFLIVLVPQTRWIFQDWVSPFAAADPKIVVDIVTDTDKLS